MILPCQVILPRFVLTDLVSRGSTMIVSEFNLPFLYLMHKSLRDGYPSDKVCVCQTANYSERVNHGHDTEIN